MAGLLYNKFKGGKDKVMMEVAVWVMLLVSREIMQKGRQGWLNVIIVKMKDTWLGNALSVTTLKFPIGSWLASLAVEKEFGIMADQRERIIASKDLIVQCISVTTNFKKGSKFV
ncbi:hypothetical protein Tco_0976116 [Tanacetum coccineum]|uniref:Uncharacterized protein n=1 Tax=Tanacetum coccineum TaxID=301880 RepID=A0ABQ5EGB2_9ASTR